VVNNKKARSEDRAWGR